MGEQAAKWFHEKWGIPLAAYQESIQICTAGGNAVPQWYLALTDREILGGLGVIENDFHNRKDLSPNVCAVYVEEAFRNRGIAGSLLKYAAADMAELGFDTLYLLTDHTSFYERYGWEFFCTALGDGEEKESRMYRHIEGEKMENYQDINADVIDRWVKSGWEWGIPISHETFLKAKEGQWDVVLTPNKPVPKEWFGELKGKKILGLASGGGQQMPIFAALGAVCTVLDYSPQQLESEKAVALREGYDIRIIRGDMTKPLPFEDGEFDFIFHPVSNCYVREVKPIFKECFRVLRPGGVLISGLDNGVNFLFWNENNREKLNSFPVDPVKNPDQREAMMAEDDGYQFSHTMEEQVGGQLEAGFQLTHLYEDTNGEGVFHDHNIPCFLATRAVKGM